MTTAELIAALRQARCLYAATLIWPQRLRARRRAERRTELEAIMQLAEMKLDVLTVGGTAAAALSDELAAARNDLAEPPAIPSPRPHPWGWLRKLRRLP